MRIPPLSDHNAWSDFWYYIIGVNVIPAHTKTKTTLVSWKDWQVKSIPQELHEQWKRENKFSDGLAIVVGKVWRGEHAGKFLTFVDCDNPKAIKEFRTRNGKTVPLMNVAEKFLVEQHIDDPNRAHIYFYSDIHFVGKSSDTNKVGTQKIASNEIPALEVKGLGTHGIAYCTPSVHKNGERYQIIGTTSPTTLNVRQAHELMQHIDSFLTKYGLDYLKNNAENGIGTGKALIPMEELGREDFVIHEGHN
nr:bifunctional DNA primase/polymerase [Thermoproteota archaeon]